MKIASYQQFPLVGDNLLPEDGLLQVWFLRLEDVILSDLLFSHRLFFHFVFVFVLRP